MKKYFDEFPVKFWVILGVVMLGVATIAGKVQASNQLHRASSGNGG